MLQTVYREIDFDDERMARQQRDRHLSELQAQGMDCVAEDLYNAIEGWRVFTLVATLPPLVEETDRSQLSSSVKVSPRSQRLKLQDSEPQKLGAGKLKRTYEVR